MGGVGKTTIEYGLHTRHTRDDSRRWPASVGGLLLIAFPSIFNGNLVFPRRAEWHAS